MQAPAGLCSAPAERVDRSDLARALAASWDRRTAYRGAVRPDNPAFGQCYPTARVVQWLYPEYDIASGEVWTGSAVEHHFWNVRGCGADADWLDLSWQQFPPGSVVRHHVVLDRSALGDSVATVERCVLLLRRVLLHLRAVPDGL